MLMARIRAASVRLPPVPAQALLSAVTRDKKRRGGRQTWVLAREPGDVLLSQDVPDELVLEVGRELEAIGMVDVWIDLH